MYILGQQTDDKLQDILKHAAHEIEYYQTFFSTQKAQKAVLELSDFPLLTRQVVQKQLSHFLYSQYQSYPDIEHLLIKRSFGRSGIPLEIYWDSRDDARSQAFLWKYRKERFGITVEEKCCVFRTAEYAGNKIMDDMSKRLSQNGKILSFSMKELSLEHLKACVDAIIAFDPAWMILPPSIALMLVETMTANRQSPPTNLRYIELYGELPDVQTENIIRDVFDVKTSSIYATQSAGAVAASCSQGHMHIFSENAVVEVIREGKPVMDEEGDIYITSIQNTAMPLIRLKTGDRGVLQDVSCPCGRSAPVLRLTKAGDCGFITTVSGRKISAYVLRSLAEYTNEEISRCLANVQFRQTGNDCIEVIMGVKPAFSGWEEEAIRIFKEKIRDAELKQMQWNFIFTNLCDLDETKMDKNSFFEFWEGGKQ